jgi:glycosyltransferase involved in cell wall biosynthesis
MYHALEAWDALPDSYHAKAELHLFGAVSEDVTTRLEEVRTRRGNIILHGFLSNSTPEYVREHAISDCMLCPTFAEGQSATALEGMSFGLYSIVSPYTGSDFDTMPSSTILSHEPERWVEELKAAMMKVIDTIGEVRAGGPAMRAAAQAQYPWSTYGPEIADYIEEVCARTQKHA